MGKQVKKKARSFSLTDQEFEQLLSRMAHHGFDDRNLYLLALIEADEAMQLEAALDPSKRKVLRSNTELRLAAESPAPYHGSSPSKRGENRTAKRKAGD